MIRLKDGTYAVALKEWNWTENTKMQIFKDSEYSERLYETFVDIELNGKLKTKENNHHFGPLPIGSNFHRVLMTVRKVDIEYV